MYNFTIRNLSFNLKAAILTIGNELVSGFTIDTNSAWLGQKLLNYQIIVEKISSVRDHNNSIKLELESLLSRKIQYLFITGGLGPTHDDITREAIQQYFNLEEEFDQHYFNQLKDEFAQRGIEMSNSNRSQAIIYKNCKMLLNLKGTAKGISFKHNKTNIFVLPGVPIEMKAIFNDSIIKDLHKSKFDKYITLKSFGIAESNLADRLNPILNKWDGLVEFAFLPSHKGVDLRLGYIEDSTIDLKKIKSEIFDNSGEYFYGINNDKLESIIVKKMVQKKLTIAVAESCTGGQLSNYITSVSGSSKIFLGGVIAYSNKLKVKFLGIDRYTLEKFGAVSQEIAIQMAQGIQAKTNAHIGIGITGISGPTGGSDEKPVGLVYVAVLGLGVSKNKKFIIKMDRNMHQEMTAYIALNMVRRYYLEK